MPLFKCDSESHHRGDEKQDAFDHEHGVKRELGTHEVENQIGIDVRDMPLSHRACTSRRDVEESGKRATDSRPFQVGAGFAQNA